MSLQAPRFATVSKVMTMLDYFELTNFRAVHESSKTSSRPELAVRNGLNRLAMAHSQMPSLREDDIRATGQEIAGIVAGATAYMYRVLSEASFRRAQKNTGTRSQRLFAGRRAAGANHSLDLPS